MAAKKCVKFATSCLSPCTAEGPATATPNVAVVSVGAVGAAAPQSPATGDAFRCSNAQCGAVLSRADAGRLTRAAGDDAERVWTCVFCGATTHVRIDPAEVPSGDTVEYVLAAAGGAASEEDVCSVFVVDVSGSMTVTSEVRDGRGRTTYVSRLSCVQRAIAAQIDELAASAGSRRVSLMAFSDDVEIIGDGTRPETTTVAGEKLGDWDALVAIGSAQPVGGPVRETAARLKERVTALEEQGSTALGPALLLAVAMASARRGSRIVVLTDGMSNCGLGAVEGLRAEALAEAGDFYRRVGVLARDAGVVVSVLGIAGTKCSMENLGKVADITGGDVDLVNPQSLSFKDSVAKPTKATGVSVRLLVHPSLSLGNSGETVRTELVGNVDEDSACTYSCYTRPDVTPPSEVPIQVQIAFTRLDGSHCLRVTSLSMPFVADTRAAIHDIDVLAIGMHVSKVSARLVQEGLYDQARKTALAYRALLEGAIHTPQQREGMQMFLRQLHHGESALDHAKADERMLGLEVDETSADVGRFRSAARGDDIATSMYAMRSKNAAACLVM